MVQTTAEEISGNGKFDWNPESPFKIGVVTADDGKHIAYEHGSGEVDSRIDLGKRQTKLPVQFRALSRNGVNAGYLATFIALQ